jgi:uncharacterized protein YbaR (Trm112 family)
VLSREFLELAQCLHTGTRLRLAGPTLVEHLNQAIAEGRLKNKLGESLAEPMDAALINEAGDIAYPVHGGIPVLLRDEAIEVPPINRPTDNEDTGAEHE